jgi:hypothetical protein
LWWRKAWIGGGSGAFGLGFISIRVIVISVAFRFRLVIYANRIRFRTTVDTNPLGLPFSNNIFSTDTLDQSFQPSDFSLEPLFSALENPDIFGGFAENACF